MLGQGAGIRPLLRVQGGKFPCSGAWAKRLRRVTGKALPVSRVIRGTKALDAGFRDGKSLTHTSLAMYKCAIQNF